MGVRSRGWGVGVGGWLEFGRVGRELGRAGVSEQYAVRQ